MRPASDLSRINRARASSGDNGEEDPPVPISNTEVKLFSAEDTWRETARENRTLPVLVKSKLCKQLASDCRQRSDFSKGKSGLCCISVIFFSNGMKILTFLLNRKKSYSFSALPFPYGSGD